MRAILLLAALLALPASPSLAQSGTVSSFTVQNTAFTPQAPFILDGVSWRCGSDNVCTGTGGQSQPATRACRRLAATVGIALNSFTYKGVTLTSDQLATCNIAAAGG
jgi:hypothetical protein